MRPLVREIIQIVLLALVVFFALHFLIQNFRIDGTSMEPNLLDRQYVLVNRTAYWFGEPGRGDIIVFNAPDQPEFDRIKRVIGLPGETVEVKPGGSVYIDGVLLDEPYIPAPGGATYPAQTVPEDEYFVMGDNRQHSYDSRQGGPVPKGNIIGKAWLILWPIGDWGCAPNESLSLEGAS